MRMVKDEQTIELTSICLTTIVRDTLHNSQWFTIVNSANQAEEIKSQAICVPFCLILARSVPACKSSNQLAICNLVPHSGQKRAPISTFEEHCGQCASSWGNLVPQSWQNLPGGPIRRQVGHITSAPAGVEVKAALGLYGLCPCPCCMAEGM